MSKNDSEDNIGVYHLDGSDTRTGLVFLSLISILSIGLSGYLIIVGRLGNGIAVGLVAALMIVGSVKSFVRLRAEITYSFGKTEFVVESTKSRNVHKMAELKSIQLTLIGLERAHLVATKKLFRMAPAIGSIVLADLMNSSPILPRKRG